VIARAALDDGRSMSDVSPDPMTSDLLADVRLVAVGSTNPVKVSAARAVIARVAPAARVEGIQVSATVRDQPWGDEETIRGARSRAEVARRTLDADLGIGIEGGVVTDEQGLRTCAWAAVVGPGGREGTGGSLAMPLPPVVAELVRTGLELGDAMDRVAGTRDVKRGQGAVGLLTAGLIDRQRAYETLITYALVPFLVPTYWEAREARLHAGSIIFDNTQRRQDSDVRAQKSDRSNDVSDI
jgi:inosine/xanthosine triphosphatase